MTHGTKRHHKANTPSSTQQIVGGARQQHVGDSEVVMTDVYSQEHVLHRAEDNTVRFLVKRGSKRVVAGRLSAIIADRSAYEQARRLSEDAVDSWLDWRGTMQDLSPDTIKQSASDIRTLLEIEVWDPGLNMARTLTVADLLAPGRGAEVVRRLRLALEDAGMRDTVIVRLLRNLRVFARYTVEHHVLACGIDLRELYGPLACPLGDRDVPRTRSNRHCSLPTPDEMPRIYEAATEWASSRGRQPIAAHRTVTGLVIGFDGGLRGREIRRIDLADQIYDRSLTAPALTKLQITFSKNGEGREVPLSPYGLAYTNYWLKDLRPRIAPMHEGFLLPPLAAHSPHSNVRKPLSGGAFHEAMGHLLDALKQRGLIHRDFSFHWTRKTFATHRLEEGWSIRDLLQCGGWLSLSSVAPYIHLSNAAVDSDGSGYRRTLGTRQAP